MKVKVKSKIALKIQPDYRYTSVLKPGEIIDLPDELANTLLKKYPKDFEPVVTELETKKVKKKKKETKGEIEWR